VKTYTITESKAQLSALVEEVLTTGQPAVSGRAGKPTVQLVPWQPLATGRKLGLFRGHIHIADDYDSWSDAEKSSAWTNYRPAITACRPAPCAPPV
jgi:antitoxin (DNA-binding transcriptional repressor) of toxin-antitoxin stability system